MNRYKKLLEQEKDKGRPYLLKELIDAFKLADHLMVLKLKVLTPDGNSMEYSWTDRKPKDLE